MREIKDKTINVLELLLNNKIVLSLGILLVTLVGGYYYYGIISQVYPNGEDCISVYTSYLTEKNQGSFPYRHFFSVFGTIFYNVSYYIKRLSFDTIRLNFSLMYSLLLLLSCILVVFFNKRWKNGFYSIPVLIILLVEMHTFTEESKFGWGCTECGYKSSVISFYPGNYHIEPIVITLMSIMLLQWAFNKEGYIRKIMAVLLSVIPSITYIRMKDMSFLALLIVPLFVYGMLYFIHNEKYKRYIIPSVVIFLILLSFTRVLVNTRIHHILWKTDFGSTYGGIAYGDTSWAPISSFSTLIDNFVYLFISFFNADRGNRALISAWSFLVIIRIIMMIMTVSIEISIIKSAIKGTANDEGFDFIDQILAFGLLLFILVKLFTVYNLNLVSSKDRYFFAFIALSAILLSRNLDIVLKKMFKKDILSTFSSQLCCFIIGMLLAFLAFNDIWGAQKFDCDAENIDKCIEYVRENGEGWVEARYHLYARMAIQAGGDIFFSDCQIRHDRLTGNTEPPRYVITSFNEDDCWVYGFGSETEEELIKEHGEPVEIVNYGPMYIYRFW